MPAHRSDAQRLGVLGERAAARYLRRRGYTLLAGGYRARCGEIDLIAVDHHGVSWVSAWFARWLGRPSGRRTVVFIEVKTRQSLRWGSPARAVDAEKQKRLADAAQVYLKSNRLLEHPARFDVIAILWPARNRVPASLQHHQNAFQAPVREPWRGSSGPVYG